MTIATHEAVSHVDPDDEVVSHDSPVARSDEATTIPTHEAVSP
ncbi:hypothetical protein AB0L56_28550 [Streptomyces sp. NPDC052079]